MILGRIALLPVLPPPEPQIHDEFSYLLAADTFAHGRLANPPLPMPEFFESPHVLVTPVYASKYPPGQGLVLAFGQRVFGHPYWGVVLSGAAMVFLFCWAADAWLPPQWTLIAGVLASVLFFVRHYWFTSYWGGAVTACGGALVVGSLGFVLRGRMRSARFAPAIGALILFATRPYEGGVMCLVTAGMLVVPLLRLPSGQRKQMLRTVVLPNAVILAAGLLIFGWYNARVTGHVSELPYTLYMRQYDSVPPLWIMAPFPEKHYGNENLRATWEWCASLYTGIRNLSPSHIVILQLVDILLSSVWLQFMTFGLLLFGIPWSRVRNGKKWLVGLLLAGVVVLFPEIYQNAHYSAPFTVVELILIVAAGRALWYRLATLRWRGPAFLLALIVLFTPLSIGYVGALKTSPTDRGQTVRRLQRTGGKHLLFVAYARGWDFMHEWVYNGADLDAESVVVAHLRSEQENRQLMDRFAGRTAWIVQLGPAQSDLRLERYQPALARSAP